MRNWRKMDKFSTPVDCDVARELGTINTFHRRQLFQKSITNKQLEIDLQYLNEYNTNIHEYQTSVLQRYNDKLMSQIKQSYQQNLSLFLTEVQYETPKKNQRKIKTQAEDFIFAQIPNRIRQLYFSQNQQIPQQLKIKNNQIRYCKLEPEVTFKK